MHIWNVGYPSPNKPGAQNHLFRRLPNLKAILPAYIFRTKHDIPGRQVQVRWQLQGDWSFQAPSLFSLVPVHRTPSMWH